MKPLAWVLHEAPRGFAKSSMYRGFAGCFADSLLGCVKKPLRASRSPSLLLGCFVKLLGTLQSPHYI